ncbi:Membrane protein involved in aromatic hydrocarbon degradation [uncultured delta proteobacterium]|uniref:Membrane protein involved in aromatic hydrocarbon degradation n=1 Tax=uncultured delta proteobacterium TaxID=34034 RepID=A0A212JGI5_9DELT|nr:Membrane protein involved in aromatic hydrocarbon degradation [uncultured delta proteobacterium]
MVSFFARLACATVFVLAFAATALAEGFALYEYSARGIALGGSLVARKPDASAIAYNPALLARLPGVNVMAGVSTITPIGKIDTYENGEKETTGLRKSTWAIPHLYYTHQINDKFTLGVGEFTRYGLGFEYPHNWPGRFNIYEVSLQSASIAPNLAWAATDKLSLAAGPEIVYVNLDLKKRANVPLRLPDGRTTPYTMEVDSNIQDASDTSIGWNVSGHYQFNDQWAVGLLYRSQVRVHAKGEVEYTMINSNSPIPGLAQGNFDAGFHDGKAHSTVILPDSYTGGIAFTPIPELSFEFAATYTRWSSFRDLNIHLPQPIGESRNHKHWKDVWRLGFGVEYSPLDWLTMRAGYVFDQSPMPTGNNQDYLVPTNDRNIWSLGLGFNWESWTLDLAYAFIDAKSRIYHANAETNVLRSRTHESSATHIGSISLSYRF